jgi:hypothetical protein
VLYEYKLYYSYLQTNFTEKMVAVLYFSSANLVAIWHIKRYDKHHMPRRRPREPQWLCLSILYTKMIVKRNSRHCLLKYILAQHFTIFRLELFLTTTFYKYYCQYIHNGMSSIKTVQASQGTRIYQYKNIKRRILKCCAIIYFNKQRLIELCLTIIFYM